MIRAIILEHLHTYNRVQELETKYNNDYYCEYDEENGSSIPGYGSGVECTSYAHYIADKENGSVFGFFEDENPTSEIAQAAGGHDFAIVDGRYIVDPWISQVETMSERCVFDLNSLEDQPIIKKLYGDRSRWKKMR